MLIDIDHAGEEEEKDGAAQHAPGVVRARTIPETPESATNPRQLHIFGSAIIKDST
jgi:hypothetical protein